MGLEMRLRACADPQGFQHGALEEVVGGLAHDGDRGNLGHEGGRPEKRGEHRLGAGRQFGGNHDRNKRPGDISTDNQNHACGKTPADIGRWTVFKSPGINFRLMPWSLPGSKEAFAFHIEEGES